MKEFEETFASIYEKGDRLIAERNRRRAVIRRITFSVSGVCAAIAVGFGIWHNKALSDGMKGDKFDIDIIPEETTTVTETIEPTTSTVPRTTASTVTAVTTAVTSASTSAAASSTVSTSTTTVRTAPKTTVTETVATEIPTTAQPEPIELSIPMSCPEMTLDDLGDYTIIDPEKPADSDLMLRDKLCDYEFTYIDADNSLKTETAEVFGICDTPRRSAVAVSFAGTDGYYVYENKAYQPSELVDFITRYSPYKNQIAYHGLYYTSGSSVPEQFDGIDYDLIVDLFSEVDMDYTDPNDDQDVVGDIFAMEIFDLDLRIHTQLCIYTDGYICTIGGFYNGKCVHRHYGLDPEAARQLIDKIIESVS